MGGGVEIEILGGLSQRRPHHRQYANGTKDEVRKGKKKLNLQGKE